MKKILALISFLFLLSPSSVIAQDDFCVADFDYSGGVDAGDVGAFLDEYLQRTIYSNPCPPDGPAPVAKTGQTTSFATGDDGYQSVETLLVHDGSDSYITIYASICSNVSADIVELSSNIDGVSGNVTLFATTSSSNTNLNLTAQRILT